MKISSSPTRAKTYEGLLSLKLNSTLVISSNSSVVSGLSACITTVMVLTMERYVAIKDPLSSLYSCTKERSTRIVCTMWPSLLLYWILCELFIIKFPLTGKSPTSPCACSCKSTFKKVLGPTKVEHPRRLKILFLQESGSTSYKMYLFLAFFLQDKHFSRDLCKIGVFLASFFLDERFSCNFFQLIKTSVDGKILPEIILSYLKNEDTIQCFN